MKTKLLFTVLVPMLLVGCGNSTPAHNKDEIKEISISAQPTKLEYVVGEFFDPTGLAIKTLNYGGEENTVTYTAGSEKFTFSPSLTTALTLDDTSVTVTYENLSKEIAITVSESTAETYTHTINFQNATNCKSTETTFEERFLPNFIHEEEQLLINLQTTGMVQVVNNEQTIEYTSWLEKVLSIGNASNGGSLELTFKDKLVSVEIEARAHVKFYYYSSTQGISADSNSVLKVNGSAWALPTPSLDDYDNITKSFNINANKLTLNTNDVANGRVTIFKITFTLEK